MEILRSARGRHRRRNRRCVLLAAITGLFPCMPVFGQTFDEYQVKAAFLYNFAKFVEWPAASFASPASPIVIGVLGPNPFGKSLEEITQGKTVGGRPLVIRTVEEFQQAGHCHILFVAFSDRKRLHAFLTSPYSPGVLTVGETADFTAEGGMIGLNLEDGRIRLEINVESAQRAGLHISSKLLNLVQVSTKAAPHR